MTVQNFEYSSQEINFTNDYAFNHLLRIWRTKTGHKMLRSRVRNVCQKYTWI